MLQTLPTFGSVVEALLYIVVILLFDSWLDQQDREPSRTKSIVTAKNGKFDTIQASHSRPDELQYIQEEQSDKYVFSNEIYFSATKVANTDVIHRAATKASMRSLTLERSLQNKSARSQKTRKAYDRRVTPTYNVRASRISSCCNPLALLNALEDDNALFMLHAYRGQDDIVVEIYEVSMKHADHEVDLCSTNALHRLTESEITSLTRHHAALPRWLNNMGSRALRVSALAPSSTTTPQVLDLDSESGPEWKARSEASHLVQRGVYASAVAEWNRRSESQRRNLSALRTPSGSSSPVIAVALVPNNEGKDDLCGANDLLVPPSSVLLK